MSAPARDMRPETVPLFDQYDHIIAQVDIARRLSKDQLPRRIMWQGRLFVEGDGTGFYQTGEFYQVSRDLAGGNGAL